MVILIEVILTTDLHKQRISGPCGSGPVTIGLDHIARCIDFRHQPFIGIDKVSSNSIYFFPQPSTERVIVVL